MNRLRVFTASEQVAAHLRSELRKGTWVDCMPGADLLARDLGIGRNTIDTALLLLEQEGLLLRRGVGRRRRVVRPDKPVPGPLRVRILPYCVRDRKDHTMQALLYRMQAAGHAAEFAGQTLLDLKMDVRRVARYVSKHPTDAWVVSAGSQEVLAWFAEGPVPAFALVGRMRGLSISGVKPDKIPAQREAIRRLVGLGHRRIVKLLRPERVRPAPGALERAFIGDLESLGIRTGPYNLTVWNGERADFQDCLDSLFRFSPPTALFLDEPVLFLAAQQYLARRGIFAPQQVSLISDDPDPYFEMFDPPVSHIAWKPDDFTRQAMRWLNRIACGKDDRRQTFIKATFVEGGTIGPVFDTHGTDPLARR